MVRPIAGTILAALTCFAVHAQSPGDGKNAEPKLEFEVATVKPSAQSGMGMIRIGPPGGPGSSDPGRMNLQFTTVRDLMSNAYDVKRFQISGVPDWADSQRFDVVAKVPAGTTKEQAKIMLQNLLADRFQLKLHRETKEMPMYALMVGPKGPKLKDTTVVDPPPPDPAAPEGGRGSAAGAPPPPPPGPPGPGRGMMKIGADGCPEMPPFAAGRGGNFMMMTPNGACMISNGQTMTQLASQLSNQFARPVVDQTGLTGKYDIKLRFDPSSMPSGRGGMFGPVMMAGPPPAGGPPGGGDAGRLGKGGDGPAPEEREQAPTIFAAVQEQLGLKLEAKKGPVEMLVIDRVEKPTEN